jgi:hypothetical protein
MGQNTPPTPVVWPMMANDDALTRTVKHWPELSYLVSKLHTAACYIRPHRLRTCGTTRPQKQDHETSTPSGTP